MFGDFNPEAAERVQKERERRKDCKPTTNFFEVKLEDLESSRQEFFGGEEGVPLKEVIHIGIDPASPNEDYTSVTTEEILAYLPRRHFTFEISKVNGELSLTIRLDNSARIFRDQELTQVVRDIVLLLAEYHEVDPELVEDAVEKANLALSVYADRDNIRHDHETLSEQYDHIFEELCEQGELVEKKDTYIDGLERDLNARLQELEALDDKYHALQEATDLELVENESRLCELADEVDNHVEEILILRDTIAEHEEQIDRRDDLIAHHEQQLVEATEIQQKTLRREIELNNRIQQHTSRIEELEDEVNWRDTTLFGYEGDIEELRSVIRVQNGEITDLSSKLEETQWDLHVSKVQSANRQAEVERLEKYIEYKEEHEDYVVTPTASNRIKELEKDVAILGERLQMRVTELVDVQGDLDMLRAVSRGQKKQNYTLRREIADLTAEQEEYRAEEAKAVDEITRLFDEIDELKDELAWQNATRNETPASDHVLRAVEAQLSDLIESSPHYVSDMWGPLKDMRRMVQEVI